MLQLYTANILYGFYLQPFLLLIHLKWCSSSFKLHQIFPSLMVQMFFPQIQQSLGPNFRLRKVGKFLKSHIFGLSLHLLYFVIARVKTLVRLHRCTGLSDPCCLLMGYIRKSHVLVCMFYWGNRKVNLLNTQGPG